MSVVTGRSSPKTRAVAAELGAEGHVADFVRWKSTALAGLAEYLSMPGINRAS